MPNANIWHIHVQPMSKCLNKLRKIDFLREMRNKHFISILCPSTMTLKILFKNGIIITFVMYL